jgi:phosphoglycolate phosphatase
MPTQPISIIFDLDGTLVDTAPDLLAALNFVLTKAGHRAVAPAELRHLVGYGVRALFERAFLETSTDVSAEQLADYSRQFLDHYRANIARESRPFPGVPETLDLLAQSGAKLGVCTNKPHDLTELLLADLDLTKYFPAVHGAGRMPYNKPDARHVLDVLEALSGTRECAIFIGDSPVDVAAARAARIPVIVMSYGYTPVPAAELGADAVTDDFTTLPGLISRLVRCN